MTPRSVFLTSQGWTLLVRDDEDGLWRAPQGGICRAKEAEESALNAMAVGLAYFFANESRITTGAGKASLDLIRSSMTAMVIRDVGKMLHDEGLQARLVAATMKPEMLAPLRDFLRAVLAIPDESKKETVLQ